MCTVPFMFVPSGSFSAEILTSVTLKPSSLLSPRYHHRTESEKATTTTTTRRIQIGILTSKSNGLIISNRNFRQRPELQVRPTKQIQIDLFIHQQGFREPSKRIRMVQIHRLIDFNGVVISRRHRRDLHDGERFGRASQRGICVELVKVRMVDAVCFEELGLFQVERVRGWVADLDGFDF